MEARHPFNLLASLILVYFFAWGHAWAGGLEDNKKVSGAAVAALQAQITALQAQVTYLQTVIDAMQGDEKQTAVWWQDYLKGLEPQVGQSEQK